MMEFLSSINYNLIGKIYALIYLFNFIAMYSNLKDHYRNYDIVVGDIVTELFKNLNPFRLFLVFGLSLDFLFHKLDYEIGRASCRERV